MRLEAAKSNQLEVESPLSQRIRELEARNRELTAVRDQAIAELQERARVEKTLREQTQDLTRSNQDLEQFVSVAAHDLQQPLHSIQILLDRLRTKYGASLDGQGQNYLNRVVKAAGRMQQLIEGLYIYSRIDGQKLAASSVSLTEVVEQVLADLRAEIEQQQAEIQIQDLPVIYGDSVSIRQLLQNLISNALKFHKPGIAPVVQVSGTIIHDRRHTGLGKPRQLCQINIRDQGIGIPNHAIDKIFGLFRRLHREDAYDGTGIGLAICQRIVEQCGGAIAVRSTVGEGSTFTVTLPAGN